MGHLDADVGGGKREPRGLVRLATAVVAVACAATYANSLGGPFVFDDLPAIVDNASIRRLWPLVDVLWPEQAGGITSSGRPLVNLSLALNHAVGGLDPRGYRMVNVAIHVAAALTLLGLVRRILLLPRWRSRFRADALPLAFSVAMVWALHPLQTESVTYVVQRAESLVSLCYLFTLYAFVRAADPGNGHWRWMGLTACAAGMTAKEVMVSAPLLAWILDATLVSGSVRESWRRHGRWHLAQAACLLVLVPLVAAGGGRGGTAGFAAGVTPWSYALTQFDVVVRYLRLALWPEPLVFDYGLGVSSGAATVLLPALVLAALLGLLAWAAFRRPAAAFPGLLAVAALAPSSSLVPIVTQTAAEHRMYLALAGVVATLVLAAHALLGRRALILWLAVAPAAGLATARRNLDYRTELALWSDTAAKAPGNARAHNNLGQALFRAGRVEAAVAAYGQALALQPKYPETHYNLGVARMRQGEPAAAAAHYREALRHEPDYPEALNNLGNALRELGRPAEAAACYEEARRRRPDWAAALQNLGNLHLEAGWVSEARVHFERAVGLAPVDPEARYHLGNALAAAGDMAGALARYDEALRLHPGYAAAQVNAGNALLGLGRPVEALERYLAAEEADPSLADAPLNRGTVLLDLRRPEEAASALAAALRLRPGDAGIHRALGAALVEAGRPGEALPHYEAWLRARPEDADSRAVLAALRARLGR